MERIRTGLRRVRSAHRPIRVQHEELCCADGRSNHNGHGGIRDTASLRPHARGQHKDDDSHHESSNGEDAERPQNKRERASKIKMKHVPPSGKRGMSCLVTLERTRYFSRAGCFVSGCRQSRAVNEAFEQGRFSALQRETRRVTHLERDCGTRYLPNSHSTYLDGSDDDRR